MLKDRLKFERNKKKISQRELGDCIGVSQQTIGSWETGRTQPDQESLKQLSQFFNVSLDYLMGESNIRNASTKISSAIENDTELADFWNKMKERESLQLLFKQTKDMDDRDINQVLRIIKAIEDEEDKHDSI